ncbi:MAG: restriction endonuclease subunit S [Eubacteriales bacterium]|nr:restriction endonuclease subunit S [Eubacteriales bacterium]
MDTKALRQKILDLAIRGKLVPQDPNDEPASVLLERIRAEKEQMVKDGKLKAKDIKNDTIIFKGDDNLHYEKFADGSVKCIEDEIPFNIPASWMWTRIASISEEIFAGGDKPANFSKEQNEECPYAIYSNGVEKDGLYGFTDIARVIKPSITVSGRGTIGFSCVRYVPFFPIVRLITITPSPLISLEFLDFVFKRLLETGTGSSIPQLTVPMVKPKLIPIPPLNEQKKIVITATNFFEQIEIIDEIGVDLLDTISIVKSKILDLAIRGKLVPQNPNDEPASVLLERIRAEKEELIKQGKIKRDKKESVIFKGDDNSYYRDLPINWAVSSLSEITTSLLLNDGDWILSDNMVPFGDIKLIQLGSVGFLKYADKGFKYLTPEMFTKLNCTEIHSGYMLINRIVSDKMCACVLPEIEGKKITTVDTCWIAPKDEWYNLKYILFAISSPIYQSLVMLNSSGTTRKRISKSNLISLPLALPPLAEQKRIVDEIEKIFAVLDDIANQVA